MLTERLPADAAGVARAVALLRGGGIVALPTETVYGLAADAGNGAAVAKVYAAKGRPSFNPLIVHVADLAAARRIGRFDARAEALAGAFWPGPLTLVLPLAEGAAVAGLVTAGLDSVALRVPAHPAARAVLESGLALAAPSANPSGRVSPTRAEHVLDGLDGRIDAVLDAGPCAVGIESTIVGLADGTARLLRPGGLPVEAVEAALGAPLAAAGSGITAPGQLASHYAPEAALRLNVTEPRPGERLLGFGPVEGAALNLSPGGDMVEAAAGLFEALRRLDAEGDGPIAVSPIPDRGLGRAINDRLARAAAPRS